MNKLISFFVFTSALCSCSNDQKFEKEFWAKTEDMAGYFPNRKFIVNDLIENYPLKGKSIHYITDLLGAPQDGLDSNMKIWYDVETDFGSDIDPVSSTSLLIEFDHDTLVKNVVLHEWKN